MQNHIELILVMLAIMALTGRGDWLAHALAWVNDPPEKKKDDEPPAWANLLMFKKGGGSAPSPDPAIGQAALKEAQLGEEWLKFSQEQFGVANERQKEQDKLAAEVTKNQLDASKQAQQWATQDRDRYQNTYVPLENDFIDKANNWDSAERQDKLASEAKADVLTNAAQQRGATQRQMAGMGVSPTSGRYAGVDRAQETATALSAAGAENTARNTVRNQAVDMKANAINMGKGMAVNPATSLGLGVNSGSAAYGTTAANNQQSAGNTAIVGQGYQGAMNGYNSQAGILNQQYQGQLSAWQTQQQANSSNIGGLMSGLGSMAGMAMMSSKELKEDKSAIDDGVALDAVNSMPVEEWTYKDGVADGGRHIGPYAEDFQRATGKGDGRSINLIDSLGVTMKAVQDLSKKVDRLTTKKGLGIDVKGGV